MSATGQFLSATNGHNQRPPTGSSRCPLTIMQIGQDAGCDSNKLRSRYFSTPVLEYANEHSTAHGPFLMWQVCSGFAHGRPWAALGMNAMEGARTETKRRASRR
jgi:hypothetical protein